MTIRRYRSGSDILVLDAQYPYESGHGGAVPTCSGHMQDAKTLTPVLYQLPQ